MRSFLKSLVLILSFYQVSAQPLAKPKLVIGLVVDQMRWDYLYRYYNEYSAGGFRRLLREGFSCDNTMIPYTPTYTAPGHTCIYTGSVPALHGIIGNNWYVRDQKKIVYCTDDAGVQTVGSTSVAGKMSPRNNRANTISDELRLATNFKNKTIAIALKDRASILPGGHTANAAYWFDNATGGWITSTYYMNELPAWVSKLNDQKLPDTYLKRNWNTLNPIEKYTQSTKDNEAFENNLIGGGNTFPHILDTVKNNKYELFRSTPWGNTYTFDMARAAIENEKLGSRGETDMLAISLSSTDYVGHSFGPNSIEVEDVYLRLDQDIAAFLNYLDQKLGKGQYVLFLSADHGVAHIPSFEKENKLPAGLSSDAAIRQLLNDQLKKDFDVPLLVSQVINYQVYFDTEVMSQHNLDKGIIKQHAMDILLRAPGIGQVIDLSQISAANLPIPLKTAIINGYNQKLSGDLQFVFLPQWFEGGERGTTHGAWNPYDAHIPLVWFGWNIKSGRTVREVYMTDIAPTLAALLHIQMPNAAIGKPIEEVTGTK